MLKKIEHPSYRVDVCVDKTEYQKRHIPKISDTAFTLLAWGDNSTIDSFLIAASYSDSLDHVLNQHIGSILLLVPEHDSIEWQQHCSDIAPQKTFEFRQTQTLLDNNALKDVINEYPLETFYLFYGDNISWGESIFEAFLGKLTDEFTVLRPDQQSRTYNNGEDLMRIRYNKSYLAALFRYAGSIKNMTVLEVGCSDGMVCDLLLSENPQNIIGIDAMESPGANYQNDKIDYFQMDAHFLNFPDNHFDVVISIATLEHVSNPYQVMSEIIRVTKPEGFCYIQSAPLYHSAYGHHIFGGLDHYPWIHLRLNADEIIVYCRTNNISLGLNDDALEAYIKGMLNPAHINGLYINDYQINTLINRNDLITLYQAISYEGENLLSDEIKNQLKTYNPNDLVTHGFELVIQKQG